MPGKYALSTRLGAGTFGVVYAATVIATGQPVVIKRIRDEDGKRSGGVPATALREASILLEMEHSNVIRCVGGVPGTPRGTAASPDASCAGVSQAP